MRKLILMLTALMFAGFVGLAQIGVGSAFAQPNPPATPQFGRKQNQMGPAAGAKKAIRTFQGTIEKRNGQYVLEAGGATYHLSTPATAKQFLGKNVTVKGTLNVATDTIRVLSIEAG